MGPELKQPFLSCITNSIVVQQVTELLPRLQFKESGLVMYFPSVLDTSQEDNFTYFLPQGRWPQLDE